MSEGIHTPEHPHPFKEAGRSLASVLPPLTVFALYVEGGILAVLINLAAAGVIAAGAYGANLLAETPSQWIALAIGVYAAVSWIHNLKLADPATFGMMFRSRAFVLTTIGFPAISFVTYGVGFWSPTFMIRVHDVSASQAGTVLGVGAALGGWVGITMGGWLADHLRRYTRNARVYIGLAVPVLATPFALGFLYAGSAWVAYGCSFAFSVFSPMWIGAAASTVNDLVMPRMRALASAYYILMNTFVGLALGPYLMGQASDVYVALGWDPGDALRRAMLWGLTMMLVSMAFLLTSLKYLSPEEDSRLERARALGEPC